MRNALEGYMRRPAWARGREFNSYKRRAEEALKEYEQTDVPHEKKVEPKKVRSWRVNWGSKAGAGIDKRLAENALQPLDHVDMSEKIRIVSACKVNDKLVRVPRLTENDFEITRRAACKMLKVKSELESDSEARVVTIDAALAKPEALKYVVEYVQKLDRENRTPQDIERPISFNDILLCVDPADRGDAQTMQNLYKLKGKNAVFDIIHAANFLGQQSLLQLGLAQIATLMKDGPQGRTRCKSPVQVRQILATEGTAESDECGSIGEQKVDEGRD